MKQTRALVGLLALACSGADTENLGRHQQDYYVANGEEAMECAFPTVVATSLGCTATLIHPRVIVTAAHCWPPSGNESFFFGEQLDGQEVQVERCARHPDYRGPVNVQVDYSYCILKDPVDVPITPFLPRSCYEDALPVGSSLMMAGYGLNESSIDGIKRWSWTSIREFKWDPDMNRVLVGYGDEASPGVSCPGDSGGPLLYRSPDGSWWNLGILSTIVGSCGGQTAVNRYTLLEGAIEWIEDDSGIDITPCSNDGQWDPGPECQNIFSAEPGMGHGNWQSSPWCDGTPKISIPGTCGMGEPPGTGGLASTGGTTSAGGSPSGGSPSTGGPPSSGGSPGAGGRATGGFPLVETAGAPSLPDDPSPTTPAATEEPNNEEASGCQCTLSLGSPTRNGSGLFLLLIVGASALRRRWLRDHCDSLT